MLTFTMGSSAMYSVLIWSTWIIRNRFNQKLLNINGCKLTPTQNGPSELKNTDFRRLGATKTVHTVRYSTTLVQYLPQLRLHKLAFTCLLLLEAKRELGWWRMVLYCLWYSMTHSYISIHFHATTSHHTSRVLIFHQSTWSRL